MQLLQVGDDVLAMVGSGLPLITDLDLSNCNMFGDEGLRALGRLPDLRRLNLQQCNGLSSRGLYSLRSLPSLTWLNISHVTQVDDAAMEGIGHLTELQTLDMTWCAPFSIPLEVHRNFACLLCMSAVESTTRHWPRN